MRRQILTQRRWAIHVLCGGAAFGLVLIGQLASAQTYRAERMLGDLNHPLFATHAPGDPNALYIVQQRDGGFGDDRFQGTIVRYDLYSGTTTTFLTATGLDRDTQGGLHSLAFHPDYQPGLEGSKLYIVALKPSAEGTAGISDSHLEEWALNSSGVPEFQRKLLRIPGLKVNEATHAMNWIGFRPGAEGDERDWLYITLGDGGIQCCGTAYVNHSQDLNSLYGKVLRVGVGGDDDVPANDDRNYEFTPTLYHNDDEAVMNGPGATAPEVYYSGLRNPWRASFDRQSGDFWLADVGRAIWEEIDYIAGGVLGQDGDGNPAAPGDGAAYGIDFGWSNREGPSPIFDPAHGGALDPDGPEGIRPDSVQPIASFPHNATSDGHFSITGGYVYRGPVQDPAMQGKYFWSDFILAKSFAGSLDGEGVFSHANITSDLTASAAEGGYAIHQITSYVEDAAGNLYLLDFGDECAPGCTGENGYNGFLTQFGTGELYRISVVPRLPGDYNDDGSVNAADYVYWRNRLGLVVGMPNDDTPGVGMDDFDRWKANYGMTSMEGSGAGTPGTIPEPSVLALAALAAACCCACQMHRGARRPFRGSRC